MPAIESLKSVTHGKISATSNFYVKEAARLNFWCGRSRVLPLKPPHFGGDSTVISAYRQTSVSRNIGGFDSWGGFFNNQRWKERRIQVNSSCEQDSDSKTTSSEKSEGKPTENQGVTKPSHVSSSTPSPRRRKNGWWKGGKWQWKPIIPAQEIWILLLQLGVVMFDMRLPRLGISLSGSEPRTPMAFVSVPYSDFLSKINNNQVQKAEVDGVHILFRLKFEPGSPENEVSSTSKLIHCFHRF
ncbi:hypothetical protein NE237_020118 [Protea cynaroides]|uniref:Peptidase M41 FtsH extracellular domain-containing protein n=1 Tax=Protea cynaroides TaxID=273540 RepID=A0A9Q0H614_9MAGN|nr:hypothetical protein NE237_020118 [Protea cynaroides]